MIYNCKFGEFGVTDGQFTEPSGVAINSNNEIIVADTNSHRIQIFDREGRFKFKFGECGKREGQLLYPNRVAVVKHTGDIVVTERSPTHQIQVYNQYGHFLRKFGANILQHPRGVCVDSKGRIIVVECKVMRVLIFDLMGNVLQKFNCSKYLEFPNGCCCSNDREEIFISDNRAHCIKVFNYEGQYMRQIGGEGITNYPIGVGINLNGEVLVADNHNNFNLTVFTQDGQVVNALESKVKHAQCFDVGLMDDGSIVLASKDYRIYVYRYNSLGDCTVANPSLIQMNNNNNSENSPNQIEHPNNKANCFMSSLTDFSF
jgi:tripartite motif-containing protein 2/3